MSTSPTTTLAITAGDPCGIGPEVVLKALAAPLPKGVRVIVIGDLAVFTNTAAKLRMPLPRWTVAPLDDLSRLEARRIGLLDLGHPHRFTPGKTGDAAGAASLAYLDAGIRLCRRGAAQGLVTAPVTKWAIERTSARFVGQTEYLAQAFSAPAVAMMFVSERLRVVLVTRHVAIREVPVRSTKALMQQTIDLTVRGLRRHFAIRSPRLAVCGLNPHAGEGGLFGAEERRVLLPVLTRLRRRGVRIDGPLAADGYFAARPSHDAVICWYHDQGLIPFKLVARDRGCQLSLGLPVVRTSPDHGSALDIAGRGAADPGSMRYAIRLAADLAARRSA